MTDDLLQAINLNKVFGQVHAVSDVSLDVARQDFLAIIGRSGSGKTTTMHLLAGLESPTSGQIMFRGRDISQLSEDGLALWRREHVGLIFQAFHLVPTLSALENVAFPLFPTSLSGKERRRLVLTRLEQVGLEHRASHRPDQLSGGEQQRVAIARALVNEPSMILADEPTGNLDSETSAEVISLLQRLNQEEGVAIIMISHEPEVASAARRVVKMKDGKIVDRGVLDE